MPLLIGGATTSAKHTAVKIAPAYAQPTVHVLDASRAVGVVSSLLEPERSARRFDADNRARAGAHARRVHASRQAQAAAAATPRRAARPAARSTGDADDARRRRRSSARACSTTCRSADLVPYIDWTLFFHAWELKGTYPGDLRRPARRRGGARAVRRRAGAARRIVDEQAARRARGVYGFWPAATRRRRHRALHRRSAHGGAAARFPMLRQQGRTPTGEPNRVRWPTSSRRVEQRRRRLPRRLRGDRRPRRRRAGRARSRPTTTTTTRSWSKALADRLAEAFAEYLHARARRDWGYGADETLVATTS